MSPVMRVLWALGAAMVTAGMLSPLMGEIAGGPAAVIRVGIFLKLTVLLSVAISIIRLVALIRRRKKLTKVQRVMFLICFLFSATFQIILVEMYLIGGLYRTGECQRGYGGVRLNPEHAVHEDFVAENMFTDCTEKIFNFLSIKTGIFEIKNSKYPVFMSEKLGASFLVRKDGAGMGT